MATINGATSFTQQVLAVWTDGKTSCAVRTPSAAPAARARFVANGTNGGSEVRQDKYRAPLQYQIPINKYNTLHSIAVKRSASAFGFAQRFPTNDDHKTRVFAAATKTEPCALSGILPGNQHRHRNSVDTGNHNIQPLQQLRRQLDLLEDARDTSSVIRILRDQMDEMEKESQRRQFDHHHHHHHQQQKPSGRGSSEIKTETKGVQADWMLLTETEAELIGRSQQRLSVPDLTKPRQRIGSKSHSVDDDDAADDAGVEGQRVHQVDESVAEELKMANDRLLTSRLREANLLAHLKDYRSRAEDLCRLISLRDAHIGRLEDEICRLKDALVEGRGKEKEMQSFISDLQLTLTDLHSKYEEYKILGQLRDAEHTQVIDTLEKQIARLKEEKHVLTFGYHDLGSQGQLSKLEVHFQSTGDLGSGISPVTQSPDKVVRGHRSVESSPATRRSVRYKEAEGPTRDDGSCPCVPRDDEMFVVMTRGSSSSSSAATGKRGSSGRTPGNRASQSPTTARKRLPTHDRKSGGGGSGGGGAMKTSASFNGRCTLPHTNEEEDDVIGCDEDDDRGKSATCRRVSADCSRRGGGAGGGGAGGAALAPRANSIPRNCEPGVPRTRSIVRKSSYICGIQEHSMMDDLTDAVD